MERLLFVDDDKVLLEINRKYFENLGYIIDACEDAAAALKLLKVNRYDVLILDIKMEHMNGVELCRFIRQHENTQIIFLTNLTEESALVEGFEAGADDYITKPYRLKELELRIRARIQNSRNYTENIEGGSLFIRAGEKQAYLHGQALGLTVNEFEILAFLVSHKGEAYSQEEIYRNLWGENYYNTHSIQVLIMRIRKKMQQVCPEADYIKTKWGKGYIYTE